MMNSLSRRATIAAAIAASMTILSINSSAFTTNGYIWTNSVMPYVVNPVNLDISPQAAIAAIRVGADAWPQQASINFAFSYAGQSGQTTNTYDGVNLVLFRN